GGLRGGHCSMTLSHKGLGVAASICVNLNSFSVEDLTIGALQIVSFYHDHPDARYKGRYKDWRDFDIFEMPQGYALFAPDDDRPADVPLFPRTGKNTCLIKGVSDYGSPGETIRISGKTLSYGV
ncbi:MAG: hypothetical protein NDJ24_07205, partial [Alphaproteobacteria bacterium]|nr:hypothetical protein [Alphaproteobacteria bacterium]